MAPPPPARPALGPEAAERHARASYDRLVYRAALGRADAFGALALVFDRMLLDAIGEVAGDEVEPDEVLERFFLRLLEQRWNFIPGHHEARAWLKANVQALARGEDEGDDADDTDDAENTDDANEADPADAAAADAEER